jgi:hypothetical protein
VSANPAHVLKSEFLRIAHDLTCSQDKVRQQDEIAQNQFALICRQEDRIKHLEKTCATLWSVLSGNDITKAQFRRFYEEERKRRERLDIVVGDLKDALGKYGRHLKGCKREDMLPCDCGFYRALEGFATDGEVKP